MATPTRRRVAVVGATGLVGGTIAEVLKERRFPVGEYIPIATSASMGQEVEAFGLAWPVRWLKRVDFSHIDYCFFTAGAAVSREHVQRVIEQGCRVVDNTTAFRMDAGVPLVVPEINGAVVTAETRLASCPNCTTIVLVMTLAPLLGAAPIERVVVTSFQSVSGAGKEAIGELLEQSASELKGGSTEARVFSKPIAFNCLPQVGNLTETGFTVEEEKIIEETRKILSRPDIDVVPTAVRVPVRVGHAVSVNVEFAGAVDLDDVKSRLREASGVAVDNKPPTPRDAAGTDTVIVGRLRGDPTRPHAISYWAVGDNLRKGAATNSVQIAELMERNQNV